MKRIQTERWRSAGALSLCIFLFPVGLNHKATFEQDQPNPLIFIADTTSERADDPKPLPAFIERSLDWLAAAQFEDGSWGAGSHAEQQIRDPRAVTSDPATTAFSAMALARAGNTLKKGPYKNNLRRALDYSLNLVETAPEDGWQITNITGTQPQAKLGRNIDVSMVAQFLTRMVDETKHNRKLHARVKKALNKCVRKIQSAQREDGSWNDGGWAPVLQSAMANSALERANEAGAEVDVDALDRSRQYQEGNVGETGDDVRTESAAGIKLYSLASGQRAAAPAARDVERRIRKAKDEGVIREDAKVDLETLEQVGYSKKEAEKMDKSYRKYKRATEMLDNDEILSGFGNNGGEEFLSYMMTSESLAATGGNDWHAWYQKMTRRFEKIQNSNGSWSGHHCITSPVFSTAAVVLTVTADRDEYRFDKG